MGGSPRFAVVAATAATTAAYADVTLLNVSYDPTRELYKAINAAFAADWKAKTGETVTIQTVARRLGRPGARGDRRARGRRRDAGARRRHRRDRRQDRQDPGRLAEAAAAQFGALHLDDRVPGAQGQSQGHPRLGRPDQARRLGDHAQSQDLRRRALELSRRLGLRAEEIRRRRGQGQGVRRGDSTRTSRCSTPARAARPSPSSSAASATCCSPGKTRRSSRSEEFGKDQFEIVAPSLSILAEPPVVGGRRRRRRQRHAQAVAEAYLQFLVFTGGAGDHRQELFPSRAIPNSPNPTTSSDFPSSTSSPSTGPSAAGRRRRRRISPTAACSTKSRSRGNSA